MKRAENSELSEEALDRLCAQHLAGSGEEMESSSGFTAAVMEAVRMKAAEPEPIAFPWRRVFPGILASLCTLFALIALGTLARVDDGTANQVLHDGTRLMTLGAISFTSAEALTGAIVLACCLTGAAVMASFRWTRRSW